MSHSEDSPTLPGIVTQCSIELFDAYEISLEPQLGDKAIPRDELVLGGIIGFTGETLQGTIVICATQPLLDSPPFANSSSQDWIGELANQLLGRIKNQLLKYGITIYLSTPVTMKGQNLNPEPCNKVAPLWLRGEAESVVVWFDVEHEGPLTLVPVASDEAPTQSEGELLLF